MYLQANQNYSSFNCQIANAEKNDCFVRSIASATEVTYRTAHSFCKKVFNRVDRKGTKNIHITSAFKAMQENDRGLTIGNKSFSTRKLSEKEVKNRYKVKGDVIWRQKTIKSFVQAHPKGTFIVLVAKHALTIQDGELLDWDANKFQPTRKVQGAYQITAKSQNKIGVQLSLFN